MSEVVLAIETDEATSLRLREELAKVTNSEVLVQKRENLGGMVADFITILQAASPIVTAVVPLIIALINEGKVHRIKIDNIEIENPTEDRFRVSWERRKGGP